MKEGQVQVKLIFPISVKESAKTVAKQKGMTMNEYFLKLHQSNIEAPMYCNKERNAIIREIGLHLKNAKQSLQLECTKITYEEIEEAIKKYETLI